MTGFHAQIDYQAECRMFRLKFVNCDGDTIAAHSGTAKAMSNLATGLDVEAHEARMKQRGVEIVLPSVGGDDGFVLDLTAKSAEILADQIRAALVKRCIDASDLKKPGVLARLMASKR